MLDSRFETGKCVGGLAKLEKATARLLGFLLFSVLLINANVAGTESALTESKSIKPQLPDMVLAAIRTAMRTHPDVLRADSEMQSAKSQVKAGEYTNDTDLLVRVSLIGTNAVDGDVVKLYDGITLLASVALTAGDIANSYLELPTGLLANGNTYNFNATITDAANNTSLASAGHTVTIDNCRHLEFQ